MKVVALAGGVGGAKLVDGLARNLSPANLTTIVNTGDDFTHFGLNICPDLDTVCYTLAGLANPETGWGQLYETWNALDSLERLGGPVWFRLGDRDLGTHLERTRLLREGFSLSQITKRFCQAWNVTSTVLPMSDDPIPTLVYTDQGDLPFQAYFVREQCTPHVRGFAFQFAEQALPAPGVLEALGEADIVIICPSNPWVSIDPILSIPGVKPEIRAKALSLREPGELHRSREKIRPVLAVSPIIGGQAVKGPAAKMYSELGVEPSAFSVARHYGSIQNGGLLAGFVFDHLDAGLEEDITGLGIEPFVTNTLMKQTSDRVKLAKEVLEFGERLMVHG